MKEMGYSTYTKLYDSLVSPVMDYGSAVWGSKTFEKLDQVQHRAMRFFTGVHRLCPVSGFTGDMGWASNRVRWKLEALRLWNRLVTLNDNRLVKKVLEWDIECHMNDNKSNFASRVKQIMCDIKLKHLYNRRSQIDIVYAKKMLLEKVSTEWRESLNKYQSKLDIYKEIKVEYGVEKYLQLNIDKYEKSLLSQIRYGILPLREETGRFKNERREDRICTLCDLHSIENVVHFLFECPCYQAQRDLFFTRAQNEVENWNMITQTERLSKLFKVMPRALAKYVKDIYLHRRNKIYK